MATRLISLSIALISTLSMAASAGIQTSAPEGPKVSRIAGHRVFRVYDPKNTGINFYGPSQIFQDRGGRYWVGYLSGLASYDENENRWKSFSKKMGELSSHGVDQISQSGDGKLWFVSNLPLDNHVTCFDGERWQGVDAEGGARNLDSVAAIFSGRDGKVWLASLHELTAYDKGRWIYDISLPEIFKIKRAKISYYGRETTQNPASGNDRNRFVITADFEDSKGDIWLGTWGGGLLQFNQQQNEWRVYSEDVTRGAVERIYEDRGGRMWFANEHSIVSTYDKAKDSWTAYDLINHLPPDAVRGLKKDVYGNAVFKARDIYQDAAGMMMFATRAGLLTFKENENKWEVFTSKNSDLPCDSITTIYDKGR